MSDTIKVGSRQIPIAGFNEFCWNNNIGSLQDLGDYCNVTKQRVHQILSGMEISVWFFSCVRSRKLFEKLVNLDYNTRDFKHYSGTLFISEEGKPLRSYTKKLGNSLVTLVKDVSPRSKEYLSYPRIGYTGTNGSRSEYIHRVVATVYCDNPAKADFVNHIDGNINNYHPDNLEWCTQSENILHGRKELGHGGRSKYSHYLITDPCGTHYRTENISAFCGMHGLKNSPFSLLLAGYGKTTQGGWKIVGVINGT